MDDDDWCSAFAQAIALVLNGDAITGRDSRGQRVVDDSFLVIFNGSDDDIKWKIPQPVHGPWQLVFDTARPSKGKVRAPKATVGVVARSVVVYISETSATG